MLGILFSTANFKTQIVPPPKKKDFILFGVGLIMRSLWL